MHRLYEDYGDIEDKLVQWRSILIRFQEPQAQVPPSSFFSSQLMCQFVKMLDEIFKICHVEDIKINVQFIINQGGGGQGPYMRKKAFGDFSFPKHT